MIISALGDKENIREALRLDASDFLDKPFRLEDVRRVVGLALESGVALRNIQTELDKIFHSSQLPGDQLRRAREVKQGLMMLRAKSSIYFRKAA